MCSGAHVPPRRQAKPSQAKPSQAKPSQAKLIQDAHGPIIKALSHTPDSQLVWSRLIPTVDVLAKKNKINEFKNGEDLRFLHRLWNKDVGVMRRIEIRKKNYFVFLLV